VAIIELKGIVMDPLQMGSVLVETDVVAATAVVRPGEGTDSRVTCALSP
jgi:hypothetical protein